MMEAGSKAKDKRQKGAMQSTIFDNEQKVKVWKEHCDRCGLAGVGGEKSREGGFAP